MSGSDALEEALAGGNASAGVVRIGDTVRKPWHAQMPRVIAYVEHLRASGIAVPCPRGRDEAGRLILDYIPGQMAIDLAPLPLATVERVGTLVRTLHDAAADLPVPADWPVLLPAPEPDLICHNDLATWNLVIDGDRLAFIDVDGAGPSSRLWDLADAAVSFSHAGPDVSVSVVAPRLATLLRGYGADDRLRRALPVTMADRSRAMADMLRDSHERGIVPWGTMHVEGHGEHWRGTTRWLERHRGDLERACLASAP